MSAGWPEGAIVHDNTLDAYVARIRRKLREAGARGDDRHHARRRLPPAMSFRRRLLLTSLATLAIGLGSLLVAGNVLLDRGVRSEASALLQARADAQLAALIVRPAGVSVRDTANDDVLDRRSWVLDGTRVVERPVGVSPALDRAAVALGRRGVVAERDGPQDVRLRARPVYAEGSHTPSGTVVVALPMAPLERLQTEILIGSLVIAGLMLLAGGLAIRSAVDAALQPRGPDDRRARRTGARTISTAASGSGRRATSSPAWRRRSTGCSPASRRRAGTSSASPARSRTSCARRSRACAAAPSSRWPRPDRRATPSARRRCARSSPTPSGSTRRSTR